MHKKRGEVNEMHVCKNGNLMRQKADKYKLAVAIITIIT
jgi:hypothetical protein